MHNHMTEQGWTFSGEGKSLSEDPDYHFKTLAELYLKVDPNYSGRFSVPVLWDKKTQTIVNNESSDIMRMFTTAFEDLIPQHLREVNRPGGGLYPEPLRQKIDKLNDSMHDILNEGAYKCGLAGTQDAFNANVYPLFRELDRVEAMLAADGRKYLFGDNLTESDIRLYVTIIRFDSVYVPIFQCNLKSIRNDYPAIHLWFRRLYWDKNSDQTLGAFHKTTWPNVTDYSIGYTRGRRLVLLGGQGPCIVPPGPTVLVEPLPKEDSESSDRKADRKRPSHKHRLFQRLRQRPIVDLVLSKGRAN